MAERNSLTPFEKAALFCKTEIDKLALPSEAENKLIDEVLRILAEEDYHIE